MNKRLNEIVHRDHVEHQISNFRLEEFIEERYLRKGLRHHNSLGASMWQGALALVRKAGWASPKVTAQTVKKVLRLT
jgi:hypothetical protein